MRLEVVGEVSLEIEVGAGLDTEFGFEDESVAPAPVVVLVSEGKGTSGNDVPDAFATTALRRGCNCITAA